MNGLKSICDLLYMADCRVWNIPSECSGTWIAEHVNDDGVFSGICKDCKKIEMTINRSEPYEVEVNGN